MSNQTGPCKVCGLPDQRRAGPLCETHYHESELSKCIADGSHRAPGWHWRQMGQTAEMTFQCECGTRGIIIYDHGDMKPVGVSVNEASLTNMREWMDAMLTIGKLPHESRR